MRATSGATRLKASTTIHAGAMVVLDANGVLVPATEAASHIPVGTAEHATTSGAEGDVYCQCRQGVFRWNNRIGMDCCRWISSSSEQLRSWQAGPPASRKQRRGVSIEVHRRRKLGARGKLYLPR